MGDMGVIGIIKKHSTPLASSIPLSIYITDEEGEYQGFDQKSCTDILPLCLLHGDFR